MRLQVAGQLVGLLLVGQLSLASRVTLIQPASMGRANVDFYPQQQMEQTRGQRLDKRSWSPRASRISEEEEAKAVDLLLDELASLDFGATAAHRSPSQHNQQQEQQQYLTNTNLLSNGRLRGRSTLLAGNAGVPIAQQQQQQQQHLDLNFRASGGAGVSSGPNYPKRTAGATRHMPCFFNAITCF